MEVIKNERDGLAEIRRLIQEFLNDGEPSPKVREYLSSAVNNDTLLLIYLKGRKYRVKHAWETLKRNAEVRFNEYPEVFPETMPEACYELRKNAFSGILKARDEFGRRIVCVNAIAWNPDEVSMEQLTSVITFYADKLLLDKDAMTNGIIWVQNNEGVGWKHVREHTLPVMQRFLNIFYYAYPVQLAGIYQLNSPSFARYVYTMTKPFLTKKLKERIVVTGKDKNFDGLHEKLSPKILPKFLGGVLENHEALDFQVLPPLN